jgi:hypothetical protein
VVGVATASVLVSCAAAPSPRSAPGSEAPVPIVAAAYSGPFEAPRDRTAMEPADMVVWSDGIVLLNVGDFEREYVVGELLPTELEELGRVAADPELRAAGPLRTGVPRCADCRAFIIQVSVVGGVVEVLGGPVDGQPQAAHNVEATLRRIRERVTALNESLELPRPIPEVRVNPFMGG